MATVRVRDYFFGIPNNSRVSGLVDYRNHQERRSYSLVGRVYGHPNYKDGCQIITSSVDIVAKNDVITNSGSFYTLETVHPDYLSFIAAIDTGIPILTDFKITGNLRAGYYLSGLLDSKKIHNAKVINQNGNLVTIDYKEKTQEIFIDWTCFPFSQLDVFFENYLGDTDLTTEDLVNFCDDKTKVIFF